MEQTDSKSCSLRKKKIKILSIFTLPRNRRRSSDANQQNISKSASSLDLSAVNKSPKPKPKYSVFGTLKRNIQSKFSPNRKIVDNFSPIQNESQRMYVESSDTHLIIGAAASPPVVANTPSPVVQDSVGVNEALSPENQHQETNQNHRQHTMIETNSDDDAVERARDALSKYGWYWGPLSRMAAQKVLTGKPNGSFLVRNSETDKLQFTLSFRSAGVTLHNRINFNSGYWHIESSKYESIVDLFEDTIKKSEECVFCYVKPVNRMLPPVVVRLTNPINRYYVVPTLQQLCRFVVRSKCNIDVIAKLPLPVQMKAYIEENTNEGIMLCRSDQINSTQSSSSKDFPNIRWSNDLVMN